MTAINELREPLHDEVMSTVFRVEGDRLVPVEDDFAEIVLRSEFYPIKLAKRREDWIRTIRGHWFQHKGELESFLRRQEGDQRKVLTRRR